MDRMRHRVLMIAMVLGSLTLGTGSRAWTQSDLQSSSAVRRRPVIYVMPNALTNPGSGGNAQVVVESSHNGKEPQVAKVYHELQTRKECQGFAQNMIRDKADYFLLLQHGGGKGNRWALSDRDGNVIASGDSIILGNSVKEACLVVAKDWQRHEAAQK